MVEAEDIPIEDIRITKIIKISIHKTIGERMTMLPKEARIEVHTVEEDGRPGRGEMEEEESLLNSKTRFPQQLIRLDHRRKTSTGLPSRRS